jgi:hypothetical protein
MKKENKLFEIDFYKEKIDKKYSSKIEAPIYKPNLKKPSIFSLYNMTKTRELIKNIKKSNVTEDEKTFLIEAAKRHTVFNYSLIADYYANSNKEMQELMEQSALVIIDFDKAIEYGYVKLSEEIVEQYKVESETINE